MKRKKASEVTFCFFNVKLCPTLISCSWKLFSCSVVDADISDLASLADCAETGLVSEWWSTALLAAFSTPGSLGY